MGVMSKRSCIVKFSAALLRMMPIVVLGAASYLWFSQQWDPDHEPSPIDAMRVVGAIGKPAMNFTLPTISQPSEIFSLEQCKGQAILLHFWATWCAPCIKELAILIALGKREKKLKILAVSMDKDRAVLERFFTNYPKLRAITKYATILLDSTGKVSSLYGVTQYPESFLIHPSFTIDSRFIGPQDWIKPHYQTYYDRILSKKWREP